MTLKRAFLWTWIGGLVLFAIVIGLSLPLILTEVPGGIGDHQAAATAAEVDRIQVAWRMAGLWNQAAIAMIGDLVFIGVYGVGCMLGGRHFMTSAAPRVRTLGMVALFAGFSFLVTDYTETVAQFVQLVQFAGDDVLAGIAATVRPIKMAAWIIATLAILLAFAVERKSRRSA